MIEDTESDDTPSNVVALHPQSDNQTCPGCGGEWFNVPIVVTVAGAMAARGLDGTCVDCGREVTLY